MSETDKNKKEQKSKISLCAILSMALSLTTCVLLLCYLLLVRNRIIYYDNPILMYPTGLAPYLSIVALILGISGLIKISKSYGQLKGYTYASLGIVFALFSLHLFPTCGETIRAEGRIEFFELRMIEIARAMRLYANEHDNQYPAASQWCDLLYKYTNIGEEEWCNERYHYALNPNCEPNSPPDMVLLFETKGGWNKSGGLEILSYENHYVKGCNILFNDGHVEFVKPKKLSKLKWGNKQEE